MNEMFCLYILTKSFEEDFFKSIEFNIRRNQIVSKSRVKRKSPCFTYTVQDKVSLWICPKYDLTVIVYKGH